MARRSDDVRWPASFCDLVDDARLGRCVTPRQAAPPRLHGSLVKPARVDMFDAIEPELRPRFAAGAVAGDHSDASARSAIKMRQNGCAAAPAGARLYGLGLNGIGVFAPSVLQTSGAMARLFAPPRAMTPTLVAGAT